MSRYPRSAKVYTDSLEGLSPGGATLLAAVPRTNPDGSRVYTPVRRCVCGWIDCCMLCFTAAAAAAAAVKIRSLPHMTHTHTFNPPHTQVDAAALGGHRLLLLG